jgi:hypothetical protein
LRAFAVAPVTTHGRPQCQQSHRTRPDAGGLGISQLADPVYDLACLSVYYPGLRLRGGELLGTAGITDANGGVRLRSHAQLFDSLNSITLSP